MNQKTINRFLLKVQKTDSCWNWIAGKDRKGYGKFSVGSSRDIDGNRRNSMVSAHRFSYELTYGKIPSHNSFHGMCVLHKCDNPSCVNPEHLFLGTNEENVKDMDSKGRRVSSCKIGSSHKNSKVTEDQVAEMHRLNSSGINQKEIAKMFGLAYSTVNKIINGKLWKHMIPQKESN